MKRFLTLITTILQVYSTYSQCYDFFYTRTVRDADFIKERVDSIDEYINANEVPIDSVFATVNGVFDIVFFERYNYGNSIYGGYIFSHQAIISKVYQGNIVESYFVSYNWAEPPLSYPIQISRTKKPLEYIMDTKDFDFSSLHKDAVNLIHNDCKIIIPKEVKIIPNFGIKKEDNEE